MRIPLVLPVPRQAGPIVFVRTRMGALNRVRSNERAAAAVRRANFRRGPSASLFARDHLAPYPADLYKWLPLFRRPGRRGYRALIANVVGGTHASIYSPGRAIMAACSPVRLFSHSRSGRFLLFAPKFSRIGAAFNIHGQADSPRPVIKTYDALAIIYSVK